MGERAIFTHKVLMKWVIILGVLAMAGIAVVQMIRSEMQNRPLIAIGSHVFRAEVVDTPQSRTKGLSGRDALGEREAMLFVFDTDRKWSIWMKDMRFPIDIIWLDKGQRVVHVEHNIRPDREPHKTYAPPKPARYVLEVGAGQARKANISVGTVASFDIAGEGL